MNNSPQTSIAIYDPLRLSDQAFLNGFVARTDLVEFFSGQLHQVKPNAEIRKHHMIVGQRGMGKTSLLRRISMLVEQDPILSERFIPLGFREEQYDVRNLASLWKNCVEALADKMELNGQDEMAEKLDIIVDSSDWLDANESYEIFEGAVNKLKKRPVLFIDNADMVLNALNEEEQWIFRGALQERNGPLVICATSTFLEMSTDVTAPFYEFFRVHALDALKRSELLNCLRAIAQQRGEKGTSVLKILQREPERIQALHSLTGGNPRTLALIYKLMESEETDSVFSDIEQLFDMLTPLYKARIEELPQQQRLVFDAIALNWDPISISELEKSTGLKTTSLSSHLKRLKQNGLISNLKSSKAHKNYLLSERFFNIWYLMRHGTRRIKKRVKWLTKFLTSFYAPEEREKIAQRLLKQAHVEACDHPYFYAVSESIEDKEIKKALEEKINSSNATAYSSEEDYTIIVATLESELANDPENPQLWASFGSLLIHLEQFENARDALQNTVKLDPSLTQAWVDLGIIFADHLSENVKACDAFKKAIESDPENFYAWVNLGHVSLRIDEIDQGEKALDKALEIDETSTFAWDQKAYLLSEKRGKYEQAKVAWEKAIKLNPKVWEYHYRLGVLLTDQLGEHELALDQFQMAADLDPENAGVWSSIGITYGDALEKNELAEEAFETGLKVDAADARIKTNYAKFLRDKTTNYEKSERLLIEATNIAPNAIPPLEVLGKLYFEKLERHEEALKCFEKIQKIDPNSALAQCMIGVIRMEGLNQFDLAVNAFEATLKIDPTYSAASTRLSEILMFEFDKPVEAEMVLREAIKFNPKDSYSLAFLGKFLFKNSGNLIDAESFLKQSLKIQPDNGFTLYYLAELLIEHRQDYHQAKELLHRSIDACYNHSERYIALGDLHMDILADPLEAKAIYTSGVDALIDDDIGSDELSLNLAWSNIFLGNIESAKKAIKNIESDYYNSSKLILELAIKLSSSNQYAGFETLEAIFNNDEGGAYSSFNEDLYRLFRLIKLCDKSTDFLSWFEESKNAEKQAPLYYAFKAFVTPEDILNDVNPETKMIAETILTWLKSDKGKLTLSLVPK